MWSHTVLEIYAHMVSDGGEGLVTKWPDEGTPADWLELGLVGYCQGHVDGLVATIPLRKLLEWKAKAWIENIRGSLGLD